MGMVPGQLMVQLRQLQSTNLLAASLLLCVHASAMSEAAAGAGTSSCLRHSSCRHTAMSPAEEAGVVCMGSMPCA
ncbi:hypothetical protein COO60DRAFT_1481318 [Scenedesmus sp. NREL 46B-D3]|nr:hypothetical protein COO60DRAFT_1481318 [Scenedesmus sp. NREL 46B-D3]